MPQFNKFVLITFLLHFDLEGKLAPLVTNVQNSAFFRDDCAKTYKTYGGGLLTINAMHNKLHHCGQSKTSEIGQSSTLHQV